MRTHHLADIPCALSTICLSAANFGTALNELQTDRLVHQFLAAGGTFFDTAHCYCFWVPGGDGASERGFGAMLRRNHLHGQVVVATKGGHPPAPPHYAHHAAYLSAEALRSDIDDSLQRLGVDVIDLYYLHRDDARVPVGEIIDALNAEIARGRLRAIGASNWFTSRIAAANAYAAAKGLKGFVAAQPLWTLAHHKNLPVTQPDPAARFVTPSEAAWFTQSQLLVSPYSPTACGYFAGRPHGDFDNPVSQARRARATELGAQLGVTPTQIALAWLMNHPFPVAPILGTADATHLAEGLAAAAITLTPAQLTWLAEG